MRRFAFVLGSLAVAATASPAWAGPDSDVASAFDPGDGFDLHLTFDYQLDVHRAAIRREAAGRPGTSPTDPLPVVDDLVFASTKHTVVPKLELGLFHDVSASFAVPLVLAWDRSLELDQRDTPCTFDVPGATCVSRMSSSTLADGLLPTVGYDGQNGGAGFTGTDPTVFRGPTRSGVDQIHLGVTWAPMNQLRDDTKPTWKLGAELRLAVGEVMAMNRLDPTASTGVGRGFHELRLSTSIAKRMGWAEPFVDLSWQVPIAIKDGSPFASPGFGARSTDPSQRAGARFGFEAYAVDQGDDGARLSLERRRDAHVGAAGGRREDRLAHPAAGAEHRDRGGAGHEATCPRRASSARSRPRRPSVTGKIGERSSSLILPIIARHALVGAGLGSTNSSSISARSAKWWSRSAPRRPACTARRPTSRTRRGRWPTRWR